MNNNLTSPLQIRYSSKIRAIDTLDWKEEDGEQWAILNYDLRLLYKDTQVPTSEDMQNILNH
jgi:hypothetical protein